MVVEHPAGKKPPVGSVFASHNRVKIWPCQLLRFGTPISLSCLQVPVCFRDQFPVVLCRSSCRVSFAVH